MNTIKERTPDDLRAALRAHDDETIAPFVRLLKYAQAENIGLSALAQRTGISSGTLSPSFNGTYNGDLSAIADRIWKFFFRLEQKAKYAALDQFVQTRLATALHTIFEKTRIVRRFQLVQSPEQVGKSRVAIEYAERNNSGRTVYLKLSGGNRQGGPGDFIWSLAQRLDVGLSVSMREKRLRIRDGLSACDLIILDEVHTIWSWSDRAVAEWLDYLRTDIHDDGQRGVCLISTNSDFLSALERWRRATHYNVGQFLGRLRGQVMDIDPAEDIVPEDVLALTARYYEPGPDALRALHAYACAEHLGHFGLLNDILNESWTRAKARHRELDDKLVLAVAQEIIAELKSRKNLYE